MSNELLGVACLDQTHCDEWEGCRTEKGYGIVWHPAIRNKMRAHRLVWMQNHGEIPEGMFVIHSCDNPSCINIDHLSVGTHADNMRDMAAKGRAKNSNIVECQRGHQDFEMRSDGKRRCRTCRNERQRQHRAIRVWRRTA